MKKLSLVFVGAFLLGASGVRAQDPPAAQPPERRLATEPTSATSSGPFSLAVAVFDGYDHVGFGNGLGLAPATQADVLQQSGQRGGVSGQLTATHAFQNLSLSFTGGSTSTYFGAAGKVLTDANAALGETTKLGPRTTLGLVESFSYAPYYSLGLFPSLDPAAGSDLAIPSAPTFDLGVSTADIYRYDVAGQVSHSITDRTDLVTHGALRWTRIGSMPDWSYQDAGLTLAHRVSESLGYHVGYTYAHASYLGSDYPTTFHNIDIGGDFRRALSPTRRTIFTVNTGSTIVKYDDRYASTIAQQPTQFRILANASLDHYIGETWVTRVSYRRDWQLLEGITTPFFRNAVSVGAGGKFSRRSSAGVNASYLLGSLRLQGQPDTGNQDGHAFTGSAFVQTALRRGVAAFGEYSYYQHRFDVGAAGLGLPLQFDRNSVRGGLVFTLPPER